VTTAVAVTIAAAIAVIKIYRVDATIDDSSLHPGAVSLPGAS